MRVFNLRQLAIAAFALAAAFTGGAAAQTFEEGKHYEFKPAVYARQEMLEPQGPQKAKGMVIWNHGRSGSRAASEVAPPVARLFAQRGWDVYGLYRAFGIDSRSATYQLIQLALEKTQAMGYQKIILMGQSAGGYGAIEAVRYGSDVIGIVALAPAAFGSYSGDGASKDWRSNDFYARQLWEKFEGKPVRVAVAYFSGDVYYEDQSPNVRGPWVSALLARYGTPNLVISQPAAPKLYGHSAGQSSAFAHRFGHCIYVLMETGTAPPCAEDDPATLATFGIKMPTSAEVDMREPYAGRWFGTWSGGRLINITIFGRQGDRLPARYLSGISGDIHDKPENLDWPLQVFGNRIRRETPTVTFEFQLEGDKLIGTRTPKNSPDDKMTIVMRRAP
jgi:pimeloyl-ACP methyl ester carboxylesterase